MGVGLGAQSYFLHNGDCRSASHIGVYSQEETGNLGVLFFALDSWRGVNPPIQQVAARLAVPMLFFYSNGTKHREVMNAYNGIQCKKKLPTCSRRFKIPINVMNAVIFIFCTKQLRNVGHESVAKA